MEDIVFFDIFPWTKNFEVGIPLIDDQHKKLVEILNTLAAHLANYSEGPVLNDIFAQLAEYADYHFKSEEKIWSDYFLEDAIYSKHQDSHRDFIGELMVIKDNQEGKSLDAVIFDIVSFLSKWLAYHILDSDKRMALMIHSIDSGATLEEAKRDAQTQMSASSVLVKTVLTMYDTLSARTLDLLREKTLRLKAEKELSLSEERWKFVLEGGSENVWDWDIANDKVLSSENGVSIFDIVGNTLNRSGKESRIHPEDIPSVEDDFKAHLEGQTEFFSNKHRIVRSNGSWSWVLSRGKVVSRDSEGHATRMVGTHTDVTERELASIIYKSSCQGMFICDARNLIISVNPAFTKITGYTQEESIGKDPKFLSAREHDHDYYQAMRDALDREGRWSGEIYNQHKNGEIYPEFLSINTVLDSSGAINHYVAFFYDISEVKAYEAEHQQQEAFLLQQSRMAQMGEMLSMIAHQWRQPLGAITAATMNMQIKLVTDGEVSGNKEQEECRTFILKKIADIEKYVMNLTGTIDDFRSFYKPNKELSRIPLRAPVSKALSIISAALAADNIAVIQDYQNESLIEMHENELMQVILNILKNAQDNFKEKAVKVPQITIRTYSSDTGAVLEICDNGGGISESILGDIFDPYFSTKNEKNGTGLGLYLSKKIIQGHHNGSLTVHNSGKGVCFVIEIGSDQGSDQQRETPGFV